MPGPTKKPLSVKRLEGNPGKQALGNAIEPQPVRGLPECPKALHGAARDAWRFLSAAIREMNLDFRIDAMALQGACVAFQRATEADATIDAEGATMVLGNGYRQARPEVAISQSNWKLFKAFCAEFGCTPASRTRLSVVPVEKTRNKFAEISEWPSRHYAGDAELPTKDVN